MASKKVKCGASSFLMSKNNDTQPQNEAKSTQNTFVNDGSFLEMYKKRMEEMEKSQKSSKDCVPSGSGDQDTTTQKDPLPSNEKTDNCASSAVRTSVVSQVWLRKIENLLFFCRDFDSYYRSVYFSVDKKFEVTY